MSTTSRLATSTWASREYYRQAKAASESAHPALVFLRNRYRGKKILEIACGEGTKIRALAAARRSGVDISPVAIRLAKMRLNYAKVADATKTGLKTSSFDATLSFFSMEHFEQPEKVLSEMIRLTRPGGEVVVVTPNFGAPNRASPCFHGHRTSKLAAGFLKDAFLSRGKSLSWAHVEPRSMVEGYESDYDTVVEPYARTLGAYLQKLGLKIIKIDTCWQIQYPGESALQRTIRWLGQRGVYPFVYWGPHVFVIAQKVI